MSRQKVLCLYKQLIRTANSLKYSDKDYFLKRIRQEFENNRYLSNPVEVQACVKVTTVTGLEI